MQDNRSSLQIMHEEREHLAKIALSSKTELNFGFHVLRDSKMSSDDMYETDLLSRESNSFQSLHNLPEQKGGMVFDSIEQFIPNLAPPTAAKDYLTKTTQVQKALSNIPEVDGESESTVSRVMNFEDRGKNSMEKSTRTPKIEIEEHLHHLNRDFVKKDRPNSGIYSHYGANNFATKSLVSESDNPSKLIEKNFRPNNSESAPEVHNKTKVQEFECADFSATKNRPRMNEELRDSFGTGWMTGHPGLISQGFDKVVCSPDPHSHYKHNGHNDSFDSNQLFENSLPGKMITSPEPVLDESRFKRRAMYKKSSPSDSPVLGYVSDSVQSAGLNMNVGNSVEKNRKDGLVVVTAESVDYSNKDCQKLGQSENFNDVKICYKKRMMEDRVESEGVCATELEKQQKTSSSNGRINKSSVKNINLRDSGVAMMFGKPDSVCDSLRPLLSIGTNGGPSQRKIMISKTEADSNVPSAKKYELEEIEKNSETAKKVTLANEPLDRSRSLNNSTKDPSNVKSVTAKVTELAMPNESSRSRRNSRSPARSTNSKSIDEMSRISNSMSSPKNIGEAVSPSINASNKDQKITNSDISDKDGLSISKRPTLADSTLKNEEIRQKSPIRPKNKYELHSEGFTQNNAAKNSSPMNSKKSSVSSNQQPNIAQPTPKKTGTPLKPMTVLRTISKSPSKVHTGQVNFGHLLQKHVKKAQAPQKIGNNLFSHYVGRGEICETEPSHLQRLPYMAKSFLQENRHPFDKAMLFNHSVVSGSRKSCTPIKNKNPGASQNFGAEDKMILADRLIREMQKSVIRKDTASCATSTTMATDTISNRKGIRILKDLHLINCDDLSDEDCRLIEIMMTALDPFDYGRVNFREYQLFVLAIFGIEKNDYLVDNLATIPSDFASVSHRPSVSSVKLIPSTAKSARGQQIELPMNLGMKKVSSNQIARSIGGRSPSNISVFQKENRGSFNDPNEVAIVRYFELDEIKKIENTFQRFRENRKKTTPISESGHSSTRSRQQQIGLHHSNSTQIKTIPCIPDRAFKKNREGSPQSPIVSDNALKRRPSAQTQSDLPTSNKMIQNTDLYSERNFQSHGIGRSKSPLGITDTSPYLAQSKLKKNYSVVNVAHAKFLPFMKENNSDGNILKLEIVIGPEQTEEVYIRKEDSESIALKVSRLQRKCHLDERQTAAMRSIILKEVEELKWPCA